MIICHGWGRLSKFEVLEEIILKKRPEKFLQGVYNLHISKGQKKKKEICRKYEKGWISLKQKI